RKYVAVASFEQHQRYKEDFNAEYEEYQNLNVLVEEIINSFRELAEQQKFLTPGSKAYQVKKEKTVK
ncbi:ELL2 factor, partial [Menura novaehollandiae]|nr:ELL2 factor [Menura novaehollandiae]